MSDTNMPVQPTLKLKDAVSLLSHEARWRLLRELARGENLPLSELARRVGLAADSTSKHIATLMRLGLAQKVYGHLYVLAPAYRPAPGATTLDLGLCVLRLDALPS